MDLKFRDLKADEIECRVGTVGKSGNGFSLLLYKDARVDMNILDETVGVTNWQRRHTRDNANCIVSIWDDEKKQWIEKEDTGTESNTEAEKGLASDSFKRACTCLGIGRELYTSPFIWISEGDPKKDKFSVDSIAIENKKIIGLTIKNDKTGDVVYSFGGKKATASKKKEGAPKKAEEPKTEEPKKEEPKAEEKPKEVQAGEQFPVRNRFLRYCHAYEYVVADILREIYEEKGIKLTRSSEDGDFFPAVSYVQEKHRKESEAEDGLVEV